jgi:hypothetical protein
MLMVTILYIGKDTFSGLIRFFRDPRQDSCRINRYVTLGLYRTG